MTDTERWNCPSCSAPVTTPYCPACGERQPHRDELTFRGMLHQAVEAFASVDARLGRTVGNLLRRPGALTVLYCQGSRKPYIGPVALFLLANVLFVAMQLLPGSNIFSTPLYQHLHNQPWSSLAQDLVTHRLDDKGTTMGTYAPVFDERVAKNAQSLIILMVLPFALLMPVTFQKSRMPFAVHLAYSLHFYAFLLLFISAALLIPTIDRWLGGAGLASSALDDGLAIGSLLISAVYLFVSAGRVYGSSWTARMFKAVLLALAAGSIFLGYRFMLLLVTLYTT